MADLRKWIAGDASCHHVSRNVLAGGLQSCNHCGAVGLPKEAALYTQADLDAAVAAALDRALAAERERCAKVAEARADEKDSYGPDFDAGWEAAALVIAAAIRAQGET